MVISGRKWYRTKPNLPKRLSAQQH